jgi:hypothetical protein
MATDDDELAAQEPPWLVPLQGRFLKMPFKILPFLFGYWKNLTAYSAEKSQRSIIQFPPQFVTVVAKRWPVPFGAVRHERNLVWGSHGIILLRSTPPSSTVPQSEVV